MLVGIGVLGLLILSVALIILQVASNKNSFGSLLLSIWTLVIVFSLSIALLRPLWTKKNVKRHHIYGQYVIDRSKFSGEQADWQYNHFRFEIKKDNTIHFYETEGDKIIKTHKGSIEFHPAYKKPRLIIHMDYPRHHIIQDHPTLVREIRGFNYVFKHTKFHNVFFKKGKWKEI